MAAAQMVHAAGESSPGQLQPGTYAVVLTCSGERDLVQLADRLRREGVDFRLVFESDPPYEQQAMALGCVPARRSQLKRFFSSLPLYGRAKK